MKMRIICTAVFLVLAGEVVAQEHQATVGYNVSDAPGLLWVSGFNDDDTVQQLILDSSLLVPMVGKTINAIVFRRDVQGAKSMQGGLVSFELHVSSCPKPVGAPSEVLSVNQGGNRAKVFSGPLQS